MTTYRNRSRAESRAARDSVKRWLRMPVALVAAHALACTPGGPPQSGTQTNWLVSCQSNADCGDLSCVCGACTQTCGDDTGCTDLRGATCVSAIDAGAIALCGGSTPSVFGMCMARCPEQECSEGTSCVAGVCSPSPEATALVTIEEEERHQTLLGFGAGVAYASREISRHPRKSELFDAMFSDSGMSILRLRNAPNGDEDLAPTSEIVEAFTERLGQRPLIILNSPSPPDALKQNGSARCEGNPDTCTLTKLPDGSFDYAGFAGYWRTSLDALAVAGIEPDYISIQTGPNWVPPTGLTLEACKFLPAEGTATVAIDGADVVVEYPGYVEALNAVLGQLDGLATVPKIAAPETTGLVTAPGFVDALDLTKVDALSYHLYGAYNPDSNELNRAGFETLRDLGEENDRPLFQSETHGDAYETALLMQAALSNGATMYVQNVWVGSARYLEPSPAALINLTDSDFTFGDVTHVMRHYSTHIGSGWVSVAAESDVADVLPSAWVSPDGERITVVLTNQGLSEQVAKLDVDLDTVTASSVTRTVLVGTERSQDLGSLSPDGRVRLPGHSIVTVEIQR